MPKITDIGKLIAEVRRDLRMTQQELADEVGINRVTVNLFENSRTDLAIKPVMAMMSVLGIDFGVRKAAAQPTLATLLATRPARIRKKPPRLVVPENHPHPMRLVDIGAVIRDRREEAGLRQIDLGVRAGLSRGTINQLESGRIQDLSVGRLQRVLDVLGLEMYARKTKTAPQVDVMVTARDEAKPKPRRRLSL